MFYRSTLVVLIMLAGCTTKPTPAPEAAAPVTDAAPAKEAARPTEVPPMPEHAEPATPGAATSKAAIIAVKFVSTTGTVAPEYWRSQTLTVSHTLATEYVVQSHYGDQLVEGRPGLITQAQFDTLTAALQAANFTQVTSTDRQPAPVGGGSSTLTVVTDQATYVFRGGSTSSFPSGIGEVFAGRAQYMPQ